VAKSISGAKEKISDKYFFSIKKLFFFSKKLKKRRKINIKIPFTDSNVYDARIGGNLAP